MRLSLGSDGHTRAQVGDLAFPLEMARLVGRRNACTLRSLRARDARRAVIRYHARWVLPISAPPIRDGTVVELGGRIVYVGPRDDAPAGTDRDLGDCALVPGLVNAHTHLELTVFRGLLEDLSFRDWIARLQARRSRVMTPERFLDSARWGIAEGVRAGITTFADTCDSGVVLEAMRERGVRGIMYQEVFSPSADPAAVREAAARLAAEARASRCARDRAAAGWRVPARALHRLRSALRARRALRAPHRGAHRRKRS